MKDWEWALEWRLWRLEEWWHDVPLPVKVALFPLWGPLLYILAAVLTTLLGLWYVWVIMPLALTIWACGNREYAEYLLDKWKP